MRLKFGTIAAICFCALPVLRADVIDFEAQAAGAPSGFNGVLNSPLVINGVTFTGGQLLNHESGASPDQTGVYATISPSITGFPGYTNPLPITFSTPVSGFSVLITNVLADTFTVLDNLGGSQTFAIGGGGQQVFTLADSGITSVLISSTNRDRWDFAIDNVTFTKTPEPASVLLLLTGLGVTVVKLRKMSGKRA